MTPAKRLFSWLIVFLVPVLSFAQPSNDNCATAIDITIGNAGFTLGPTNSVESDLTNATLQAGEVFAPGIVSAGLTKKSVWYKFTIPTTRSLEVFLKQNTVAIADGNVGFAVYKTNTCLPAVADISTKLTPIAKFASSKHPCLEAGTYYVQVSSSTAANGKIFISLQIGEPDPAAYDKPATASKFGKVSTYKTTAVDFDVSCQSIDDANEVCLSTTAFKDYTKSTWHTFTTPDFFDYFAILISGITADYWTATKDKLGFRLYEGDATTTPVASLIPVGGCDSISFHGYYAHFKTYKCGQLKPNTTYTVQLLYHRDFNKTVRFAVSWNGEAATRAPQPISSIPSANKIGVLPNSFGGITTYATPDNFSCNARHINYNCPKTLPVNGIFTQPSGYNIWQNMSVFYSFSLTNTAKLDLYASSGCNGVYIRLFKQSLTVNCTDLDTSKIYAVGANGTQYLNLDCVPAGDYVVQIMGSDTADGSATYNQLVTNYNGNSALCLFRNLGSKVDLRITATTQQDINTFSLNKPGAVEKLNTNGAGVMQPIQLYKTYNTIADTLGCENTVLPADNCGYTKSSFREFVAADSGFLNMTAVYGFIRLYKGDVNALAIAQNKFSYPEMITGLEPVAACMPTPFQPPASSACIAPGTYTLVSSGPGSDAGRTVVIHQPTITHTAPKPKHPTPTSAQDMGDLWAQLGANGGLLASDIDTFTCYDNPATIDGLEGCEWGPHKATKLIYRQFYLSQPSNIRIALGLNGYTNYYGYLTLFSGKATDGIAGLKAVGNDWKCFYDKSLQSGCQQLSAGWYTVVAYGHGQSFENQATNVMAKDGYSTIGRANAFYVLLYPQTCPGPKFNRPYKASVDTNTKKPYLVEWKPQASHTAAYPNTGTTYTFIKESFNCTEDTAFIRQNMLACNYPNTNSKVAFWVFQLTQESFVRINAWGLGNQLFAFDVRGADSVKLKNTADALQPCFSIQNQSEYCRLQPGYYTLAVFAPSTYNCNSVEPVVYIDQVAFSRFDHANNAYDFGEIAPDSLWHKGKKGDVNPLNAGRSPSNDFFYCTTGTQDKDPVEAVSCYQVYNPFIYPSSINKVLHPDETKIKAHESDRRNLWYTFTVNNPGLVYVKVTGFKGSSAHVPDFAIYKSDEDGSIPFNTLKATGKVDSTKTQGLTFIAENTPFYYGCQPGLNQISFYVPPCDLKPTRYYILVEKYHYIDINSQVEVEILLDSIITKPPKFDHYSQANDLGTVNSGKKKGAVDNFTCATRDLSDPLNFYASQCQKTLWYKFTTTVTGTIRYAAFFKNQYVYGYNQLELFRQVISGDSTTNGLIYLPETSTYYDNVLNATWAQQCISPGTYYMLLPGCTAVNEDAYPEIEIIPQAGDFCSNPLVAALNGVGNSIASVKVDCHTIGTDYGEFNNTLTCPDLAQTINYKTSWFRLDVTGTDTLDITVFINEKTNANSTDIKYRMMTGSCGAMQEQSCVQDALTRNTYECMVPGKSYYIQVFTPVLYGGQSVTGDIDLNITAVKHITTCAPANNCIAVAEFTSSFDCTKDRNAKFSNLSTFGSDISYQWDFGYNNQKSNAVSPEFYYPALTTNQTYTVTLTVTNNACGKTDIVSKTITIPARPSVNLGNDTVICVGPAAITLNAASHPGTQYQWYTWLGYWNPSGNSAQLNVTTLSSIIVELTYNNCKARDSIGIWVNPIAKKPLQTKALCNVDNVLLDANRGYGEKFSWSNGGTTQNITVYQPGYYWCDIYLNGCIVRDSFLVINPSVSQSVRNVTICQAALPYSYDATVSGASSYTWNDNSNNPKKSITKSGLYWIDISVSGCTYRDTLNFSIDSFKTASAAARICGGQTYQLPSGKTVAATGVYKDSIKNIRGCDSIITTINLVVDTVIKKTFSTSVCAGQTYTLPSGKNISAAGNYLDTVRYVSGCDSLISNINLLVANPVRNSFKDSICVGSAYKLPSGKMVSSSGVYTDTIKAKAGCDSIISSVDLYVLTPITNINSASVCFGNTYTLPSGRIVNASGVYRDSIRYVKYGCDSLISIINLSVGQAIIENKTEYICNGQSFTLPGGRVVSTSGIYNDSVKSTAGCDSLISTINLFVQSATFIDSTAHICGSDMFKLPSGKSVNTAGIYTDTLRYTTACDSIRYRISLSVSELINKKEVISLCAGNTYNLPSGKIVAISGNYKDTVRYVNGCDSLITELSLSVGSPIIDNKKVSICEGQTYQLPAGQIVSTSGMYADTVRSVAGCDSLISSIELKVLTTQLIDSSVSICDGKLFILPSGKNINTQGLYNDTLRYTTGCDSVLYRVNLIVYTASTSSSNVSICAGTSYTLPSGRMVNSNGLYRDTLRYQNGCDSIINNITLSVGQAIVENKNVVICQGQSYTLPSGKMVNTAAIYADTVRNMSGCDSLISNINVLVDIPQPKTLNVSICNNALYTSPSGKQWSIAGSYKDTLQNIRGCDSLYFAINLTVETVARTTIDTTICAGQSIVLPGGKSVSIAGMYYDTLQTSIGCDSIVTTQLTIRSPLQVSLSAPASICAGETINITSNTTGGTGGPYTYQWSGMNATANNLSVSPVVTTTYKLTVNDGCTVKAATDSIVIQVTAIPNSNFTLSATSGCQPLQVSFNSAAANVNHRWQFGTGNIADTSITQNTSFKFVIPGTYQINHIATTAGGCTSTYTQSVTVYAKPTTTITAASSVCVGSSVSFTSNVNMPANSYSWSFANGQTSASAIPTPVSFNTAGIYTVQLMTATSNNCSDTATHILKVNPLPNIGLNGKSITICRGSNIMLNAKDGVTYQWSPSTGLNNPSIANPTASPNNSITYRVMATNSFNCQATDSIQLLVTQPFTMVTTADTIVCIGNTVTLKASGAQRYEWTGTGTNSTANSITIKPNSTTSYTVTGRGIDSCFTQTKTITVTVIPLPTVNAGNDTTIMVGNAVPLLPVYSNDVVKYTWSPADQLSCINCPNPIATPLKEITYNIVVENQYQCKAEDSRKISLVCNTNSVFVPNTFTPNGDGMNDVWYPRGNGIQNIRYLRVFNRWGQMIFERTNFNSDDRSAGWDGTFKGQPVPPEVYVYSLGMICSNGQVVDSKGNVMVVK